MRSTLGRCLFFPHRFTHVSVLQTFQHTRQVCHSPFTLNMTQVGLCDSVRSAKTFNDQAQRSRWTFTRSTSIHSFLTGKNQLDTTGNEIDLQLSQKCTNTFERDFVAFYRTTNIRNPNKRKPVSLNTRHARFAHNLTRGIGTQKSEWIEFLLDPRLERKDIGNLLLDPHRYWQTCSADNPDRRY